MNRCAWVGKDPIYQAYHDNEWGKPLYDSKDLWAKFVLDSFQAGLSWITILKKRDNFLAAFDGLDPAIIKDYSERKVEELMQDKGIVRNRLKINATIGNARGYYAIVEKEGDFGKYLWRFVDGKPKVNAWKQMSEVPATSAESDAMSKALKQYGFKFCGSTICYAFMQAVGMVNDHTLDCDFR